MDRQAVESSMIKSVGYDPSDQILEVEFTKGQVYQYEGVSIDIFDTLMSAESIGKSFSQHVRSQGFPYRQV